MTPFYQWKTFWLALAALATALGGYAAGEIELQAVIGAFFACLMTVFVRHGVEKSGPNGKIEKPNPELTQPPQRSNDR